MEGILQSKSKRFIVFCFCFLIGVAVSSLAEITIASYILLFLSFLSVSILILTYSNKKYFFIFLSFSFLFFGIARHSIAQPAKIDSSFEIQTLQGYVAAEPDVRMDGVRYIVKTKKLGRIYLKTHLYPRYDYGDVLRLKCRLKRPEPIEDFRYDMYLARYGVFQICTQPKIEKVGESEGIFLLEKILKAKVVIAKQINLLWHEPHASFMAGLLYGYRGGLGSLNELFSRTGVTHIVAISGYNITIISLILSSFLVDLYIPRKKAFYIIIIGISLFVIFAGLSASVVRAGIMGVIVLLAKQMGRASQVGNVMLLTAVLMTVHNPFILLWDAGFQLSFISTLGLVYISPMLQPFFKKIPEVLGFRESIEATLSATIATLPLILFQFKRLSIVAVIVNVLILWIIPFLMLLGFLAVLFSFVFKPIGFIISWLAWLGLSYVIVVVKWFADLSFAAVDLHLPWWGMVFGYIALFVMIWKHTKK